MLLAWVQGGDAAVDDGVVSPLETSGRQSLSLCVRVFN